MAEAVTTTSAAASSGPATGSVIGDIVATITLAVAAAGMAISMAALIFAGDLVGGLSRGIGAFVFSGGLLAIWIAARSGIVPAATLIQDGPAIVAAVVAARIVSGGSSAPVADVFVLLFVASACTGLAMWLLGRFGLGGLVRYIPTTVVGAFVAGTGWLLFTGALGVMVDSSIGLRAMGDLFGDGQLRFWLPGMVLGLVLWGLSASDRVPPFAVGLVVLASLGVFYLVVTAASSVASVEDSGWLIGPFPESAGMRPLAPSELRDADWSAIGSSVVGIASIVGLSVVALLLNLTGLSAQLLVQADVDRELRATGLGNIGLSVFGSSPGYHALGDTLMLSRLGATRRAVPMVAGVVLMMLGVVGVGAVGYVPRLVVGGLLVMVGFGLLAGWVGELRRSTNRVEQALGVGIFLVIVWFGILEGIGAGVVAACAVFVVRYSRVDPVRTIGSGRSLRSRVDRSAMEVDALDRVAERLVVLELQGYLFFGSLTSLERQVRDLALDDRGRSTVDDVVFDFRNVTGVDTSSHALLGRLFRELDGAGIRVLTASLDERLRSPLVAAASLDSRVVHAVDLDRALEAWEDDQLRRFQEAGSPASEVDDGLGTLSPALASEFDELTFAPSTVVMEQGTASDGLIVVCGGSLTAWRIDDDGVRRRLRRFGRGTTIGEIGVITGAPRSAEIVADTEVQGLWLSADRYRQLRSTEPEAVIELHEFILRVQAQRIVSLSAGLAGSLR